MENISGSSDGDHDDNTEEKSAKKGNKKKKESAKPSIKSDHGDRFNALLKLCIAHLPSALEKLLGAQKQQGSKKKKALTSSKNWTKMNKPLKSYTADLVKVTSGMNTAPVFYSKFFSTLIDL